MCSCKFEVWLVSGIIYSNFKYNRRIPRTFLNSFYVQAWGTSTCTFNPVRFKHAHNKQGIEGILQTLTHRNHRHMLVNTLCFLLNKLIYKYITKQVPCVKINLRGTGKPRKTLHKITL